jgi:negative regulator of replication initiation
MSFATISIAPDVLASILALHVSDDECLDAVLRRHLPSGPTLSSTLATPNDADSVGISYEFIGERYMAPNAIEAMVNILKDLAQFNDNFFSELAPRVRGRTRNHIAQHRADIYPSRPDLAKSAREIGPGWFIGCNIANREKKRILRAACEVMGLVFGRDLKIDFAHS